MITSILFGLAALCIVIPVLRIVIPGFRRQQQLMNLAALVNQSDAQRLRLQQNAMVRSLADRLSARQGKRQSSKQREMYGMLGYPVSYEIYLARAIIQALLPGGFALVLAGMVQQVFLPLPDRFYRFYSFGSKCGRFPRHIKNGKIS